MRQIFSSSLSHRMVYVLSRMPIASSTSWKWSHSEYFVLVGLFPPLVVHGCIVNLAIRDNPFTGQKWDTVADIGVVIDYSGWWLCVRWRERCGMACVLWMCQRGNISMWKPIHPSVDKTASPLSPVPLRHFCTTSGTPRSTHQCVLGVRCRGEPYRSSVRLRILGFPRHVCPHEVGTPCWWQKHCLYSRIPLMLKFFKTPLNLSVSSNMRLIGSTSISEWRVDHVTQSSLLWYLAIESFKCLYLRLHFTPLLHGVQVTRVKWRCRFSPNSCPFHFLYSRYRSFHALLPTARYLRSPLGIMRVRKRKAIYIHRVYLFQTPFSRDRLSCQAWSDR